MSAQDRPPNFYWKVPMIRFLLLLSLALAVSCKEEPAAPAKAAAVVDGAADGVSAPVDATAVDAAADVSLASDASPIT